MTIGKKELFCLLYGMKGQNMQMKNNLSKQNIMYRMYVCLFYTMICLYGGFSLFSVNKCFNKMSIDDKLHLYQPEVWFSCTQQHTCMKQELWGNRLSCL